MGVIKDVVASWEKKCNNIPALFNLYARPYKGIVNKELQLAEIDDRDYVVNIGCGAMPFTAVYIAKLSGAKVCAIDYDQQAVKRARNCIKNLGLTEQIEVKVSDGTSYSAEDFTAGLVALQAEPKKEILENLLATANQGSRFVFRRARKAFSQQYDFLPEEYEAEATVKQWMLTFNRSSLFVKN